MNRTKPVALPTAGEIMNDTVQSLAPDTEIGAAVQMLLELGYSGAPVVDADGRPLGVLSEHDCVKVLANSIYEGWPTGTVADHMSKGVEAVDTSVDMLTLAQQFAQGHHRRILVVNEGRLVGLVTRRDLMGALERFAEPRPARVPGAYELIQAQRG